jgi:hypothetical protein
MPSIQRLELVNGVVFSVGEPWPGFVVAAEKEKQLHVSHIFLTEEETESITVDNEAAKDDDEDEEILRTSKAEYEIWGLTSELGEAFAAVSRKDVDKMRELAPTISTQPYRRRYRYDLVSCVDDLWDFDEGLETLGERIREHEMGGATATAVPPTNGGIAVSASP